MCARSAGIRNEDRSSRTDTAIVKVNPCGHIFHSTCLSPWIDSKIKNDTNATCPVCRYILVKIEDSLNSDELSSMDRHFEGTLIQVRRLLRPMSRDAEVRTQEIETRIREAEAHPEFSLYREQIMHVMHETFAAPRRHVEAGEEKVEQVEPSV
jgi:hypothetical protein